MNMKTVLRLILVGVGAFLSVSAMAQQRKYVNEFLRIGVGGRGLGMAGAQVASIDDVNAAFWNPAGLTGVRSDFQLGLMHAEYFSSIAKYDYIGTAFHRKNQKGVLGFSLIRFAIDDIPYTLNLIQPDGTVDYSKIRAISAADYAGLISYAKPIRLKKYADRDDVALNLGANLKIIHRNVGTMANAWGAGMDAGLQARVKRWRFGAVVHDITTTYTLWSFTYTDKEKQVLAQTGNDIITRSSEMNRPRMVFAAAKRFPLFFADSSRSAYIQPEVNFEVTTDGKRYGNLLNLNPLSVDPRAGLEFGYNNMVFVRAGVGNFQRILSDADTNNTTFHTLFQPSFGIGLRLKQLTIDYSFSSLNIENNPLYSHFVSVRLDILRKGNTMMPAVPDVRRTRKKQTSSSSPTS